MGVDHWFGTSGVLSNYESAAPQGHSLNVSTAPYPSGDWGAWSSAFSRSRGSHTPAYPSVADIFPLQSPSPIMPVSGYLSGAQRHGRVHQADEGSYLQGFSADLCETTPPGSLLSSRPVSQLLPYEAALYSSMNMADRSPVSPTGSILYTSDSVYSGSHAESSGSYHSQAPGSPCSLAGPLYANDFAGPNHRYSATDFEPMSYLKEPSYYVPPTESQSGDKGSITSSLSEIPPSHSPFSAEDYLPSSCVNEGTFVPPVSCHSSEGTNISTRWDLKSFTDGAKSLYSKWTERPRAEKPRSRTHGPSLVW